MYDEQGNELQKVAPQMHLAEERNIALRTALNEKYGKAPFVLGWHEIRQLLFQNLPEEVVKFDRQVISLCTSI